MWNLQNAKPAGLCSKFILYTLLGLGPSSVVLKLMKVVKKEIVNKARRFRDRSGGKTYNLKFSWRLISVRLLAG